MNTRKEQIKQNLLSARKTLRSEESHFRLRTGLKVSMVLLMGVILYTSLIAIIMDLCHSLFLANSVLDTESLRGAFFRYLTKDSIPIYLGMIGLLFCYFFVGTYLATILVRPFYILSEYCDGQIDGFESELNIRKVSDLQLLGLSTESFIQYVEMCRREGKLLAPVFPESLSRIRKPVFEKPFFIHIFIVFLILSVASCFLLYSAGQYIHQNLISLMLELLSNDKSAVGLIKHSNISLDYLSMVVFASLSLGYFILGIHLYRTISHASFALFATFRSFIRGNYSSRVHIVGHNFLRPYTRRINKYLEIIEKEFHSLAEKNKKPPA